MTVSTGATEVWQARIGHEFAAQLHEDAQILGLDGRTDIVKAALQLLHRRAAEEHMARSVDTFYAGTTPPLPIGVLPDDGTNGPETTHVPLTSEAGLTRYPQSYVDVTSLQPVARSRFRRRRGLLVGTETEHLEDRLRIYLGL